MSTADKKRHPSSGKKPGWPVLLLLNGLLLLSIFFFTGFYSMLTNTLDNNGRWESSKVQLEMGVMGAQAYMVTQRGLAVSRLDLGAWHGNQEVFVRDMPVYDSVQLKFELEEEAHFILYYGVEDEWRYALRLSADERFPSAWLTIKEGEFIEKMPLEQTMDLSGHHIMMLTMRDQRVQFSVDGVAVEGRQAPKTGLNALGFRGSSKSAWIDVIQAFSEGGVAWYESFEGQLPGGRVLILSVFLLIGLNLLIRRTGRYKPMVPVLMILAVVTFAMRAYYTNTGQFRYPKNSWMVRYGDHLPQTQMTADMVPEERAGDYRPKHPVLEAYDSLRQEGQVKVLFIGASQTWGAGASDVEHTWVNHLEAIWDSTTGLDYTCMNAAISGQESQSLKRFQQYVTAQLKPDISFINLSFNDRQLAPEFFKANLSAMVAFNQANGIQTILIPEVSNRDTWDTLSLQRVETNREVVHRVAEEMDVVVLPLQDSLWGWHDHGFLFWDEVHLTDFGQRLLAGMIAGKVKGVLPGVPKDSEITVGEAP